MTLTHINEALSYGVSTHMPLARHDLKQYTDTRFTEVSTHMPLARHDGNPYSLSV